MNAQPSLRPIAGYSETGTATWRASNDRVFTDAADKFNRQRGLKQGDPKYIDPLFLKAWAMVESGGTKSAFLRDPFQVNNPGDWADEKRKLAGLSFRQQMTPQSSADAALRWLEFKGHPRRAAGLPPNWIGLERALRRYNGRSDIHPSGVPHSVWYAREVFRLRDKAQ